MHQLTRTVARNSIAGMSAQVAIKVLSFAFSVLIVRSLGPEVYGQYAGVLAFGAVFVFIADLGLSPYLVREVANARSEPDAVERTSHLYGNVTRIRMLLAVLAAVLMVAVAYLSGLPLTMVAAIALGTVGLFMYSVQGTSEAVLAGFERLDLSARGKVLNQVIFVVVGAIALWLSVGYFGLIFANLLGIAAMTYVCVRGVRRFGVVFGRVTEISWLPLIRAGLPFGVIALTLGLSYKFDSVLLSIFRGDAETGYYNAAYNLVFSAVVFSNVLNTSLFPSLTRQAASDPTRLPAIYSRALRYLLVVALPIAVGVWALSDQLVSFLYKDSYLPAAEALRIVIWVVPLMFVTEFLGYIVVIRRQEGRVARAVVISTGVNVALNLMLVPRFGFLAAAAMTVATEAVLVGQYLWLLRKTVRELDWSLALFRPLVAALVMGALVIAIREQAGLLSILPAALLYITLILAFGVVGRDELAFLRAITRRPLRNNQAGSQPVADL